MKKEDKEKRDKKKQKKRIHSSALLKLKRWIRRKDTKCSRKSTQLWPKNCIQTTNFAWQVFWPGTHKKENPPVQITKPTPIKSALTILFCFGCKILIRKNSIRWWRRELIKWLMRAMGYCRFCLFSIIWRAKAKRRILEYSNRLDTNNLKNFSTQSKI